MTNTTDLLIELGTEELPPTALLSLSNAFTQGILEGLKDARLNYDDASVKSFATPRRLALSVASVEIQQADQTLEKLGPAVAAARDKEGNPSKAALGFAKSNGVDFEDLQEIETDKGPRLGVRSLQKGESTANLLEAIITNALEKLPIPKRMRWGASRAEFVRPAHWLLVLMGNEVVPAKVLNLSSGNESYGHRFHSPDAIKIENPGSYEAALESAHVIPGFEKRRQQIQQQVNDVANKLGGQAVLEEDLLNEVTALVEKPVAIAGGFDKAFLSVPHEALIYSMSEHQKYFHVVDDKGELMPHFITVSNIESKDPAQVSAGNERVIRPRLADAAFFYESDKKVSLENLRQRLTSIVFQQKLGTVYEKTERISVLAEYLAQEIKADTKIASTAGALCKADLASDMVLEFDKMQGVAGGYYARHEGLGDATADAISNHYLPRYAGDAVPTSSEACAVAIADRLDTLTGIFGIGQEPSGSKDPFALRRASIGILQIILQNKLALNLRQLVDKATSQHAAVTNQAETVDKVCSYIFDRFTAFYQEQGIPTEVIQAVRAVANVDALDFDARIKAVSAFAQQPDCEALAAANKRVSNILDKTDAEVLANKFDKQLLVDDAEKTLATAIQEQQEITGPLYAAGDYREALLSLTSLKSAIDSFFDNVMVNVDDEKLKLNRLSLLAGLRDMFIQTADVALLAPVKK